MKFYAFLITFEKNIDKSVFFTAESTLLPAEPFATVETLEVKSALLKTTTSPALEICDTNYRHHEVQHHTRKLTYHKKFL